MCSPSVNKVFVCLFTVELLKRRKSVGERRIALKRTLFGIEPGGGVLTYMGYIGTCRGIGYSF